MQDADSHRRCQSCGVRVVSGIWHHIGVATANPSRILPLAVVSVLTCRAQYCMSRRGDIARTVTPSLARTLSVLAGL